MATTSLKLPEDLKVRAAAAAATRGMTPHAFMLDAIRSTTDASEQYAQFVADAEAADAEMRRTGKGYSAEDVFKYLGDLVSGKRPRKPKAKSWRS